MADRRHIKLPNGDDAELESIGYRPQQEHWNSYLLDDGTVLRLKLVVTSVDKVLDKFDAEGNPIYATHSTNVVAVDAPASARRPEETEE
jgi:hypothetical protein